ncbi:MAG: GNAT family N-acetyltransferase [Methylobacteriaceae bacterium]|nr:GNAT family N-acetyltransferase [Methylobacteriaceae bacterium]
MTDTGPLVADALALACEIEPHAVAAWPARETAVLGGWLLRFTDGSSHRSNSVAPLNFLGGDLGTQIDQAERAYRAHDLRPMFHITPAARPMDLEQALLARAYQAVSPSQVCVARTAKVLQRLAGTPSAFKSAITDRRFRDLVVGSSRSALDGRERLDILGRIALPLLCTLVVEDDTPVACGVGVRTDGWISLYVMRSHPDHRRRGFAKRVIVTIARWAQAQRVANLFLQVEKGNAPARALYAAAGFVPAYPYCSFVANYQR